MNQRRWKLTILGSLAAVLVLAGASSREVEARTHEVNVATICGQLPAFYDAFQYTLNNWPINEANTAKAGIDIAMRVLYFGMVASLDKGFCDGLAKGGIVDQPDTVLTSFLWHFGNASVALQQYQKAVGAQ